MSPSQTLSITLAYLILIPSTLWNFSILALNHLKHPFELRDLHTQFPQTGPEALIGSTRHDSGRPEKCAVCLRAVGDGDEVGELTCQHVFHHLCLQSWVRSWKHMTCPLCRGSLATRAFRSSSSGEAEVIFFKFCSFACSSHDQLDNGSWWLR